MIKQMWISNNNGDKEYFIFINNSNFQYYVYKINDDYFNNLHYPPKYMTKNQAMSQCQEDYKRRVK